MIKRDAHDVVEVTGRLAAPREGWFLLRKQQIPGKAGPYVGIIDLVSEGQVIQVQAQGPEFFAFDVTGATSRQTDFTSKMTRAGTFELRVLCDGLPVCWRVVQIIAGPTHPDRCFLSMEGLKDVKTV